MIALPHTGFSQEVGCLTCPVVQFPVSQPLVAKHKGRLVGEQCGSACDEVSNGGWRCQRGCCLHFLALLKRKTGFSMCSDAGDVNRAAYAIR